MWILEIHKNGIFLKRERNIRLDNVTNISWLVRVSFNKFQSLLNHLVDEQTKQFVNTYKYTQYYLDYELNF